mmetsp:Transcript_19598/g.32233  ORF Transcript_19598/g.32233 Transcript_19598/m.32233 type:complete len:310 (+) Transcript_19598:1163-2092(+)
MNHFFGNLRRHCGILRHGSILARPFGTGTPRLALKTGWPVFETHTHRSGLSLKRSDLGMRMAWSRCFCQAVDNIISMRNGRVWMTLPYNETSLVVGMDGFSTVGELIESLELETKSNVSVSLAGKSTNLGDALLQGFVLNVDSHCLRVYNPEVGLKLGTSKRDKVVALIHKTSEEGIDVSDLCDKLQIDESYLNSLDRLRFIYWDRVHNRVYMDDACVACNKYHAVYDVEPRLRAVRWGLATGVLSVSGALFYLTFFFLSWDIIEPITYFVGSSVTITGYFWWLCFHSDLGLSTIVSDLGAKISVKREE